MNSNQSPISTHSIPVSTNQPFDPGLSQHGYPASRSHSRTHSVIRQESTNHDRDNLLPRIPQSYPTYQPTPISQQYQSYSQTQNIHTQHNLTSNQIRSSDNFSNSTRSNVLIRDSGRTVVKQLGEEEVGVKKKKNWKERWSSLI